MLFHRGPDRRERAFRKPLGEQRRHGVPDLPVRRVRRTAEAEPIWKRLKPGRFPHADHPRLTQVIVNVAIGVLTDVRHEFATGSPF